MRISLENTGATESGAHIKDGVAHLYSSIDLSKAKKLVEWEREAYRPEGGVRFLGSVPWEVIEAIRLENKWPANKEGRDKALQATVDRLRSGELREFQVHGA